MNDERLPEYPDWIVAFLDEHASEELKRNFADTWKAMSQMTPKIDLVEMFQFGKDAFDSLPEQDKGTAAGEAVYIAAMDRYFADRFPSDPVHGTPLD